MLLKGLCELEAKGMLVLNSWECLYLLFLWEKDKDILRPNKPLQWVRAHGL